MDLNELQSVRDRERQTDKLQQLRESFYGDVGGFIEQLRAERDRAVERADNPFDSSEVRQLSDEINTAEQTVKAIYEKRVGKIVKAASFAAADMPAEVDGMTAEEQDLFDQLVGDIKQNRSGVMALLDGDDRPSPGGSVDGNPTPQSSNTGTRGHQQPDGPDTATSSQESPADRHPARSSEQSRQPDGSEGPPQDGADNLNAADVMGGDTDTPGQEPPTDGSNSSGIDAGQPSPATTESTARTPPPETEDDNGVTPSENPTESEPQVRNDGGSTRTHEPSGVGLSTEQSQEQAPASTDTAGPAQTPESESVAELASETPAQTGTTTESAPGTETGARDAGSTDTDHSVAGTSQAQRDHGMSQSETHPEGDQSEQTTTESALDIERQRVQILEDVETFMGFDERDYDLESNDIVSLPAANADILLERGVAREL